MYKPSRRLCSVFILCVAGVALAQAPVPRRPFMPPPPVNDATIAYQFRTRVSTAPHCERFAIAADTVFLDDRTGVSEKAAMLKKIEAEAQAANCLTTP